MEPITLNPEQRQQMEQLVVDHEKQAMQLKEAGETIQNLKRKLANAEEINKQAAAGGITDEQRRQIDQALDTCADAGVIRASQHGHAKKAAAANPIGVILAILNGVSTHYKQASQRPPSLGHKTASAGNGQASHSQASNSSVRASDEFWDRTKAKRRR